MIVGVLDPERPWSKALAVDAGLQQSTADVVVVADGDVWVDGLDIATEATSDFDWVMPYRNVHRLSPAATSTVLQTGIILHGLELQQRPYNGVLGGGLMVMRRDCYERTPLDPAFVGWGQEDEAWGAALDARGNGHRMVGELYHLWHPPQPRQSRATGSEASRARRNRYWRAKGRPDAMAALIDEAKAQTIAERAV